MLNYIALGLIIFVGITLFYGIIIIHDIPYEIAKKRKHPHQDAIHVAGWVSLFTLHVLWPFLWIWSTLYREDRGWGFTLEEKTNKQLASLDGKLNDVSSSLAQTTEQLHRLKELVKSLEKRDTNNVAPNDSDIKSNEDNSEQPLKPSED